MFQSYNSRFLFPFGSRLDCIFVLVRNCLVVIRVLVLFVPIDHVLLRDTLYDDAGFLGPVSITIRWNPILLYFIGQTRHWESNLYVMISNELNLLETLHGNQIKLG